MDADGNYQSPSKALDRYSKELAAIAREMDLAPVAKAAEQSVAKKKPSSAEVSPAEIAELAALRVERLEALNQKLATLKDFENALNPKDKAKLTEAIAARNDLVQTTIATETPAINAIIARHKSSMAKIFGEKCERIADSGIRALLKNKNIAKRLEGLAGELGDLAGIGLKVSGLSTAKQEKLLAV